MKKILSFDLYADMGFLKKPDINEKLYLTYNMLHKPALLGILGAIVGLQGFQKNNTMPEYYQKLKSIPIGIRPIGDACEQGSFSKTIISYNNTIGFASKEEGGNLIISEQTLIGPAFRIYLLLNLDISDELKLYGFIKGQEAEYIPYLGKNDYSAWWDKDDVKEYDIHSFEPTASFKLNTLFLKQNPLIDSLATEENKDPFSMGFSEKEFGTYMYFERLPIQYDEVLFQYILGDYVYTDYALDKTSHLKNLYTITEDQHDIVIQLN